MTQPQSEKSIEKLIRAGANIIQIISYETIRARAEVNEAAMNLEWNWFVWNRVEGLKKWTWEDEADNSDNSDDEDELDENEDIEGGYQVIDKELRTAEKVLDEFYKKEKYISPGAILILEDFHYEMDTGEMGTKAIDTIRRLRNIAFNKPTEKALILLQPNYYLPKDLEKDVQLLELPYPDLPDVEEILEGVKLKFEIPEEKVEDSERVLSAALGMTISEIETAFGMAYVEAGQITENEIPLIIAEKENIIKKSGHLEYFHPKEHIEDVGGLENLKKWAERRYKAFGEGASEFGLDTPKGIMLLGIPGTGKSLFAKAIANQWQFPLLKLDMGKIFGGIVGESERNIREALKIAEALAPSILWVDEIEKGLSGVGSSNFSDGGTSARVLGTFLTWMQEKESPVFVVATANNLTLPPELLRKGRIDEIFFVDLPGLKSRQEIIKIHLRLKKNRSLPDKDLYELAKISKGLSGAEIQEGIKEALFMAFDKNRELKVHDISTAFEKTYPLAKVMGDQLDELRKWAEGRTVKASTDSFEGLDEAEKKEARDRPRLEQEHSSMFIKRKKKKKES